MQKIFFTDLPTLFFSDRYRKQTIFFSRPNEFIILYHTSLSVLGALIGKQKGRNIEVMNSFELIIDTIDGDIIIDKEYYTTKEEQCKY